jgi:predicted anti-sigma-YlaC factor YlaD
MTCEKVAQVHAFYDGELDASQSQMFEAHLERCAECRRLLDELQDLSSMLLRAPRQEMPVAAVSRIHGAWHEARDRGVLRIAGWLTAAAAMLLVGALLTGPTNPATAPAKPGLWEAIAVMPPAETQGETNSDLVQVAQWMADDLSLGGRR